MEKEKKNTQHKIIPRKLYQLQRCFLKCDIWLLFVPLEFIIMHAACLKCEAVGIRFECEMRFKHTAVLLPLFLFMKRCCCCCFISLRSISKEHWLYNCDKLYAINRFIDERKSMNMNSQVYNRMKKKQNLMRIRDVH